LMMGCSISIGVAGTVRAISYLRSLVQAILILVTSFGIYVVGSRSNYTGLDSS
jgi:hypothetical protein